MRKSSNLPPSLIANLQNVLNARNAPAEEVNPAPEPSSSSSNPEIRSKSTPGSKPVILVTNGDGIRAPGLRPLIDALVSEGRFDILVCVPESDKSFSGHSVTSGETVVASSLEIDGATAFEISGSPVDCISISLSGVLFSNSKPTLVISGITKGSNCTDHIFYSGSISAAREASFQGIPSLSISLNWKKDGSHERDFRDAADRCLPFITAFVKEIEKGCFPGGLFLNVDVPCSPANSKGFKVNHHGAWKSTLSWQSVSGYRPHTGQFMSKHQSLGIQLAQLGRDASAAGAARRLNAQRTNVEIESVAVGGNHDSQNGKIKKYFQLEVRERDGGERDEDLENGFVIVTPIYLTSHPGSDSSTLSISHWLSDMLSNI